MSDIELYGIAIVPLIMSVVQLLKTAGLNSRYAGLVAWGLGLAIALVYGLTEAGWSIMKCLVVGSALGLSASGAYSTQKNVRKTSIKLQSG